jgi:hypothetical protein
LRIGGDPNAVDRTFDGRIDEVAMFNEALTMEQLQGLYNGQVVGTAAELTITQAASGQITITWDQPGTLQSTTEFKGAGTVWNDEVTTGNTFTTTPSGTMKFYRVTR